MSDLMIGMVAQICSKIETDPVSNGYLHGESGDAVPI